jgi:hypothetical protein
MPNAPVDQFVQYNKLLTVGEKSTAKIQEGDCTK